MTERDDYLWDRSGQPDPTAQQLEQLLSGFAHDGRPLELPAGKSGRRSGRLLRRWPWLLAMTAAAAGIAIAASAWWPGDALREGAPARVYVATKAPVVVALGDLATVTLAPDSELHFEHWRPDQALFRLARGALTARVAPPPAVQVDFFQIETALGRVIDKGCQYDLSIERDGTHVVRVTEGAVTFAFPARTVFVPAGAGTRVTPKGPSTPLFDDASAELRDAVRQLDAMTGQVREKGIYAVTRACTQPRDSLVLWHLLRDDDELLRDQAEETLVDLVGPPPGVQQTKGPLRLDPDAWLGYLRIGPWLKAQ